MGQALSPVHSGPEAARSCSIWPYALSALVPQPTFFDGVFDGVKCPHAGKKSEGTGVGEAATVFDRGPIRKNKCGCLASFNRLKPKIEAKGAVWAVAHRIAKVIWLMLAREVDYIEKGPAPPNQRTLMRKLRRLAKDFALLGIDINKAAHASVQERINPRFEEDFRWCCHDPSGRGKR